MKTRGLFLLLASTVLFYGCLKNTHHETGVEEEIFDFDYSTKAEGVSLDVEYTNTGVKAPVYFEIYDTCPVDLKSEKLNYVKLDGVLPIYSAYTDANGKFTATIDLPAYASKLYVYAPAFYARTLIEAEVKDGIVKVTDAVAESSIASAVALTTTTEKHYSYVADNCAIDCPSQYQGDYKTWKTWLGEYNIYANGAVDSYVCTNTGLLPKDPSNLFLTFHEALAPKGGTNWSPGEEFINTDDIWMREAGPISVTFLGQNTCFNNSVGYYYYSEGNKPASLKDANIILIFPNTQDGMWEKSNNTNKTNFNTIPSTGLKRNTTVQLKYYPNIAEGSKEGATDIFPEGTRIGLVLACNAFSNRVELVKNTQVKNRSTTTPGLSLNHEGKVIEGETRSVIFRVDKDVFVGFEEYKDDKNFTDCVLSINTIPSDALVVEKVISNEDLQITSTKSAAVYAFEDLWPYQGDYDFNDVIVDYQRETIFTQGKKIAESFILKTYQNIAGNQNGLGVQINKTGSGYSSDFESQGSMSCLIKKKGSDVYEPVELAYEPMSVDGNKRKPVYLITDNVQENMGAEYKLTYTFNYAVEPNKDLGIDILPFIYRNLDNGKRWEVHIAKEKPTFKMDESLFGMGDDASRINSDYCFIRKGGKQYPFAIRLEGATVNNITPLLNPANERKSIDTIYPGYKTWCDKYGNQQYADWYKSPAETQK